MSLSGNIAHIFLKTGIASLILWVLLVVFLEIPMDQVPMLLLIVLIVNAVSHFIASIILMKHRGY